MRGAQINTDQDLRLQYLAGMWLNSYMGPDILDSIRQCYRFPDNLFRGSVEQKETLRYLLEGHPQAK